MMHRIGRIVPLYWLATFLYVTVILIGTSSKTATAVSLAEDLLFIPRFSEGATPIEPALSVGWTLNLEMFFYVMFALALAINMRLAPIIVAAFLLTLWLVARACDLGPLLLSGRMITQSILCLELLYFIFGTWLCLVRRR